MVLATGTGAEVQTPRNPRDQRPHQRNPANTRRAAGPLRTFSGQRRRRTRRQRPSRSRIGAPEGSGRVTLSQRARGAARELEGSKTVPESICHGAAFFAQFRLEPPMRIINPVIATTAAVVLGILTVGTTPASAWHTGHAHGHVEVERHRGPQLHIGTGGVRIDDGRHHRPRRHAHCRQVSYHDHHGRHRVRTICED